MTQKELSYVEDAVTHENILIKVLNETCQDLNNNEVIKFFDEEIIVHENMKKALMNLLEDKTNEWWTYYE